PLPFQPRPKGILLLDSCLAPKGCVRRGPCNRPNASDLHDDRFGVQLKASIAGICNAGLRTRRAALGNSNHRGILASLLGAPAPPPFPPFPSPPPLGGAVAKRRLMELAVAPKPSRSKKSRPCVPAARFATSMRTVSG